MHSHNYVHNVENVTDVVENLWKIHHYRHHHRHHHNHHHHHCHDHHHHHQQQHQDDVSHHPSTGEHVVELPEDGPADDHREVVQHCQGDHAQPLEIL